MSVPAITHVPNDHRGAFVMKRDGRRLAEMTYSLSEGLMIINHTAVDDSLRGTGAGQQLLDAAVAWARAEQRKIMPLCPFVRSRFDRSPTDYADVRA